MKKSPILLTTAQVSETYNLPTATLNGWRYKGGGPLFIKAGSAVRYRQTDVEKWLDKNTHKNTMSVNLLQS